MTTVLADWGTPPGLLQGSGRGAGLRGCGVLGSTGGSGPGCRMAGGDPGHLLSGVLSPVLPPHPPQYPEH